MLPSPDADYLAAIIESSEDAIVSKTLQGLVTSWNSAAERLFGYSAAEMVGQPITRLFPVERLPEETEFLRTISRGDYVRHFETVRVRKDGQRIDVSVSLSPIRDASGTIVGVAKIARDISARKHLDAARADLLIREQDARRLSEHANRIKDEFLTTLSHELRTPVNAVLGWACIVRDKLQDQELVRRGLDTIIRNARVQTDLIADLLDVSRIITGGLRLDVQVVDPAAIMRAAIETVRPAAQAKELALTLKVDNASALVRGDPRRLQQVCWNLLTNAVNYTPARGRVAALVTANAHGVEFRVTDTGVGIGPDLLPHVFDRFRQGDQSHTREQRGLGLGLAIVRHLVELHGGVVNATSEGAGKGATFSARLPLAAVDPADLETRSPGTLSARLTGARVLVVEDQEDARTLVTLALQDAGAEVVSAASADEALAIFFRHHFDAIVSDIAMPGKDGLAFIAEVRNHQGLAGLRTPAMALTALISAKERADALEAGFDRHVAKPIDPTRLPDLVGELMAGPR
jgi:PAS domain S-box-containing protein